MDNCSQNKISTGDGLSLGSMIFNFCQGDSQLPLFHREVFHANGELNVCKIVWLLNRPG